MHNRMNSVLRLWGIVVLSAAAFSQAKTHSDPRSLTVVFSDGRSQTVPYDDVLRVELKPGPAVIFKDGHQHSLPAGEISRIEFNSSSQEPSFGRKHFVGKWDVGVGGGVGSGRFFITLDDNGQAHKTIGSVHGTWVFVNGEARISWDDGWHDIIRRVGEKYEKVAFEPGKTFSDTPSNVASARNTNPQPI